MTTLAPLRADQQQAVGAGVQVALLAGLSVGVGLGPVGWLAGVAHTLGLWALLTAAAHRARVTTLGPACLVTLARAVLVGGVTALVAEGLWNGGAPVAPLVVIATVALILDAVDGQVARRTRTVSALGARFDMEVDAFLVLVLSVYVAVLVGPWVLAIGAMRYAFLAASRMAPWMRSAMPTRYSAKAIAAVQGIVLVVATSDVAPRPLSVALVGTALALLVWSFGRDVAWLWCNARLPRRSGAARIVRPRPQQGPAADLPPPASHGRTFRLSFLTRFRRLTGSGHRRGAHPVAARVITILAGLLVFAALIAPREVGQLTPGALVRIPVEGLVGVALLLVLPRSPRRVAAAIGGAVLGLLTIVRILDMGFLAVLARPFDPVLDWVMLDDAVSFLRESIGPAGAIASMGAAGGLVAALLVAMTLSVLRLSRLVVRHRPTATRSVAVLSVAWLACAVLGAQIVPPVPVAARSAASLAYQEALQVPASLQDQQAFAAEAAVDAFRDTPGEELLTALRGKDVVFSFVESYGRDAVEDPEFASQVGAVLDDGSRRLSAAGYASRSAFLTSPVAGGGSWLAHATFLSGLRIDNNQRHHSLTSSDRLTLTSAFRRANWQTVGVMPGTSGPWPEAAFYGYDRVYDGHNIGYRGPRFGWAPMPDQYTLSAFERSEHATPDRPPVMAEIALTSSHVPWTPIPRFIDWDDVGDGSVYGPMATEGDPPDAVWKDPTRVRTEYRRSIEYSLTSLISYVETYGDDDLVLVFLGDHQPAPIVTGEGAGRDVPITIVARDQAVLDRISGWGWQDGLKPGPQAPVWPMDAFRDRFLTAFGPQAEPTR